MQMLFCSMPKIQKKKSNCTLSLLTFAITFDSIENERRQILIEFGHQININV